MLRSVLSHRIILLIAAGGILSILALQAAIYNLDHNPIGRWRTERMYKRQMQLLQSGTIEDRMRASFILGTIGSGKEDVRAALRAALKDSNPTVAANATLGLRFGFNESIKVTRETYRLSDLTPKVSSLF